MKQPTTPAAGVDGGASPQRQIVTALDGSPERVVPQVVDVARVGVDELVLVFRERDPDQLAAAMERFDAEVFAPALHAVAA